MGLMKDELKEKNLEEIVGLRSKMYAIKAMNSKDLKSVKQRL